MNTAENQIIYDNFVSPGYTGERRISRYSLLRSCIQVHIISQNSEPKYVICLSQLSDTEKKTLIHLKKIGEKIRNSPSDTTRRSISKEEFYHLIDRFIPGIDRKRKDLIYSWHVIGDDPVRWIRVMLTDSKILTISCSEPDVPVTLTHMDGTGTFYTNIILKQADLSRLASFFMQSCGSEIPKTNPLSISLPTGEKVDIHWKRSEHGQYPSIRIERSGIQQPDTKNNTLSSPESPTENTVEAEKTKTQNITLQQVDKQRINTLLEDIFEGEPVSDRKKSHTDTDVSTPDSVTQEKKQTNGFFSTFFRYGVQELLQKATHRKKTDPESIVPEKPPLESALNLQNIDKLAVEEAYWLDKPHSYVAILHDHQKERTYRVFEPELTSRERIVLEETHETLRDVIIHDQPVGKGNLFLEYKEVTPIIKAYDPTLTDERMTVLYYYLRRNLGGYGKIEPLMHDELLEDISCNGHDLPVYVHHRYYGSMPTSIRFGSDELNRFVLKLAQKADKQVSLTSPLLDAALPNGSRAQLTYSDVISTKGSSFTIRKFRTDPMTPVTLLGFNTYNSELLALIWLCLENRKSMIVVGGTASGKTSAMNAFSFFIPHNSKIVSLEDTREIQIPHKNWLPVQTRDSGAVNERGNIDLFDLLKASLRQRPEYIIVGEVRGEEAQTLFQAMNSGHTTISTLHAGTIEEALNRLTNEPINVPAAMFGALDLMVIQTFHYQEGVMIRRCDAIHEILLGDGDKVRWNTLYEYQPRDDTFIKKFSQSRVLKSIQYMHNWTDEELAWQLEVRKEFLSRVRKEHHIDPVCLMQMITKLRKNA